MNYPWSEALGVSEQQLSEWQKNHKSEEPLIFQLLLEKKVDEEAYLKWARNHYQVASVGRSFFVDHPDLELWNRVRVEFQWTKWMLPLKIWDNTLFVGCLEIPKDIPKISMPVQFLLAPATGLNRFWKFNLSDMGVDVTITQHFATTGVNQNDQVVTAEVTKTEKVKPPPVGAPPKSFGFPNSAPSTPQNPQLVQKPMQPPPPKAETPKTNPTLKLDLKKDDANSGQVLSSISFSGLSLDKNASAATSAQPSAPEPTLKKPPGPPEPSVKKPQVPPTPPMPSIKKIVQPLAPPPPPEITQTKHDIAKEPAAAQVKPFSRFGAGKAIAPSASAQMNFESLKNFDELASYAFHEMAPLFEKCMLLVYDEFKLVVHRWTPSWNPDPRFMAQNVPLETPNIFKIAHDTKKPFHGPMSINPVNKQFFDHWNGGQIPAHVTVYPLLNGGNLFGHLLGITNNEINTLQSLDTMARLVSSLTRSISKIAA